MSERFDDKYKVGEAHELPLNHTLARTEFVARALEIQAIQAWAGSEGIQLRSEYCTSVRKKGGKIISAKVLTYDYKPMAAMAEPQAKRQVVVSTIN